MNMQSIIYLLHVISNHFNNIVLLAVIAISEKMRKAKQVVALGYKKKKSYFFQKILAFLNSVLQHAVNHILST